MFNKIVEEYLNTWHVIQYCATVMAGGPDTLQTINWLAGFIEQTFQMNTNLASHDVESMLSDVIFEVLNMEIEDGSDRQAAEDLCKLYQFCQIKNTSEIEKIMSIRRAELKQDIATAVIKNYSNESDDNSDMEVDQPITKPQKEYKGPDVDEDGFTMVSRRR